MQPHLIVPGWGGSGPDHWQTHWERELPDASRLEVADWYAPRQDDWLRALDDAIRRAPAPPIVIAHSLGCIAVAHWVFIGAGLAREPAAVAGDGAAGGAAGRRFTISASGT